MKVWKLTNCFRARLDDSGTYRISAQNCKGEISSFATLVVRRYQPGRMGYHEIKTGLDTHLTYPDMDGLEVKGQFEIFHFFWSVFWLFLGI